MHVGSENIRHGSGPKTILFVGSDSSVTIATRFDGPTPLQAYEVAADTPVLFEVAAAAHAVDTELAAAEDLADEEVHQARSFRKLRARIGSHRSSLHNVGKPCLLGGRPAQTNRNIRHMFFRISSVQLPGSEFTAMMPTRSHGLSPLWRASTLPRLGIRLLARGALCLIFRMS